MLQLKQKLPFIDQVLKGIGQIMLQENSLTGLLFLIGIFIGSPIMGVAALVGAICGTFAAKIFNFNKQELEQGIYGFSSSLVGVAMIVFFKQSIFVWMFIVTGSVLAATLQHLFIKKNIPVFTLPFVVVTWAVLSINTTFQILSLLDISNVNISYGWLSLIRGYGQVIFQSDIIPSVIFFIAVCISSPIAGLYGLIGGILSAVGFYFLSIPVSDIEMGLFSYNAVLCAIVFEGKKLNNVIWAVVAIVLSIAISWMMHQNKMIQLTFPFVAACMLVIGLRKLTRPATN